MPYDRARSAGTVSTALHGHSSESGTTLMELLAVFAMIAVLAAIALPDMTWFITKNTLLQQTDSLCRSLRETRDLAMESAFPWRMILYPGGRYWLCYGDADDDGQRDHGERVMGPFPLDMGISFGCQAGSGPNSSSVPGDGVSFVDNQICFSPMGGCNAGTIYLTDTRVSMAVRLMPASGSMRVWENRGAWREL